jgi:hypothetical protein
MCLLYRMHVALRGDLIVEPRRLRPKYAVDIGPGIRAEFQESIFLPLNGSMEMRFLVPEWD